MEVLEQQLIELISSVIGTIEYPYKLGKFEGLAWNHSQTGKPLLSIKKYGKTVNVYAMNWSQNENLLLEVIDAFGKSSVGKSCIRIRTLNPNRENVLKKVIRYERDC